MNESVAGLCTAMIMAPTLATELVSHAHGNTVRLLDRPCAVDSALSQVEPALQARLRTAAVTLQGTRFTACWLATPAGAYLFYEDGDQGVVPFDQFRPLLRV